ncbi:MAG: RagB/SusD family nutrient uptake outer membrane protein [Haliscomenobacter sp.]|uniref:RagB/SusD family nutrient uptake outer membrane protein n=1 Tax=Haliscomenobacter sp. TaxID=2717303 RepID=UPI0029B53CC6|nr:RagB/SusD family nutrient uptake outer membrane protein [Haliscomenobacter sp.]MDX2072440.1 RagB/SusD family nutrient uptake outer membrane protein [Haliscomenobacter sp.]
MFNKYLFRITASALLVLLLAPACQNGDFLEVKPQGVINANNYFQTAQHATWSVNAVYNSMRDWNLTSFPWLAMTDIVTDDAVKGSFPADAQRLSAFDDFSWDPGFPEDIRGSWRGHYQGIFRANVAIDGIPKVPTMDETLRKRLIGEAKFLRAHFYFNLVRWFGDLPLITRPLTQDEFYTQTRAASTEIYKLIASDLTEAIANLPEKSAYAPEDLGRVTKGAARGLLAKVYLTIKDYPNAEKYALEVINSNEYKLLADYTKIFLPEGENSSESVFEVQATALEASYAGATPWNMVQGVRGTPNLGWGFNLPSDDLMKAFEFGDPRRDATALLVGEALPDGSALVEDNPQMENERYNQKAWTPAHALLQDNGPSNIRILRYADVLLIAAEALNENNKPQQALVHLNAVRIRARGNRRNVLPDITITDKDGLRQKIWQERRVELAMEQQRWFDLVRTGQVEARMKAVGKNFVKGKHELFPIPQTEIDLGGGNIAQNPGY